MKKTTLVSASLLLAFAGCTCGQGWRPNFFTRLSDRFHGVSNVGAPCDAGCEGNVVPVMNGGCESCGNGVSNNYGGYIEGGSFESAPVTMGTPTSYTVPSSVPYTSPTYQPSRREAIVPKSAS